MQSRFFLFIFVIVFSVSTFSSQAYAISGRTVVTRWWEVVSEQFTSPPTDWKHPTGVWTFAPGFMIGQDDYSGDQPRAVWTHFDTSKDNLDFSVRMKRETCVSCGNGITVKNLVSFQYTNAGKYSIFACTTRCGYVKNWTTSGAIQRNGFNSLRIRILGDAFLFSINGYYIGQYYFRGVQPSTVSIFFDAAQPGRLLVDSAVLAHLASTGDRVVK